MLLFSVIEYKTKFNRNHSEEIREVSWLPLMDGYIAASSPIHIDYEAAKCDLTKL